MTDHPELLESMSRAVSAVIALAKDKGIFPSLPTEKYELHWMEPTDDARSTGKHEEREEHSYSVLTQQIGGDQITKHPDVQRLSAVCKEFKEAEGKAFPVFGMEMAAGSEGLLGEYFNRVGQLRLDDEVLNQVCTEYIDDLKSPTAVVRSVYVIENFSAPSEFNLDDEVTFRRITEQDIDTFGRVRSSPFIGELLWLNSKDWICEIRQESPKDTMEVINEQSKMLDHISVALNLVKEGRASFRLLEKSAQSTFLSIGRSWNNQRIASSGTGGQLVLDESDVLNARSAYAKVKRILTEPLYKHLRLAYRRLRDAASRRQREDILVDHVIGLESLLASDSDRLETTFRFSLRGAALLPDSFGDSRERIKLMHDLYSLRSKVVHGSATQKAVSEFLPKAENALRSIFLFYVDNADTLGSTREIIRKLDEAMVSGGQRLTQSAHPN